MENAIEVRFLKFDISEKRDAYNLSKYTSEEKMKKINKFKNDADYNRSVYADIMIRQFFMEKFSLTNEEVKIVYDSLGKPYVENYGNVYFSVSHSGSYVMAAFGLKPIGVDVEELRNMDFKGLASRYFDHLEENYIFDIDDKDEIMKRFYEIWTVKESYTKLLGAGLSRGLKYFVVEKPMDKKNEFNVKNKSLGEIYLAKSYGIDKNYIFSVCSDRPSFDILLNKIDISKTKDIFK